MALDFNLSELTLENIATWPQSIKLAACSIVLLFILGFSYWFDTSSQLESLKNIKAEETRLKASFERKQQLAANLNAYKMQLITIQKQFGAMLRQLPSKTEIPDLLEDISKSGVASGLEFQLFDPQQEQLHEFYADLPIQIVVLGDYHEFGQFISRTAGLPRIVTIQDFSIESAEEFRKQSAVKINVATQHHLVMKLTAKTYRYIDTETGVKSGEHDKR